MAKIPKKLLEKIAAELKTRADQGEALASDFVSRIEIGRNGLITIRSDSGRIQAYPDGDSLRVSSVFVDPSERGKGVGKELYKSLIKEAKGKGYGRIVSDETVEEPAAKIYQSLARDGFNVTESPSIRRIGLSEPIAGKSLGNDSVFYHAGDESPFSINVTNKGGASSLFAGTVATGAALGTPQDAEANMIDMGNPEYIKSDARFGELGEIANPNGNTSTEFSITEYVPELGGWVNIPTLVEGQIDVNGLLTNGRPTRQQSSIAIRRAIERVRQGAKLPSYPDVDTALLAAQSRTNEEKGMPYQSQAQRRVNRGQSSDSLLPLQQMEWQPEIGELNLADLLARGEARNIDTIEASKHNWAGVGADLIDALDRNVDGPLNLLVPTGTGDYLRKIQYGDEINYWDRLFANPLL